MAAKNGVSLKEKRKEIQEAERKILEDRLKAFVTEYEDLCKRHKCRVIGRPTWVQSPAGGWMLDVRESVVPAGGDGDGDGEE